MAADYMGRQIASSFVSMVDIANTYDEEVLPVLLWVDDGGVSGEEVWLIRGGVLQAFMHN